MSETGIGNQWMVVRSFHQKRRVVYMSEDETEARLRYKKESALLRNGSVALCYASVKTIDAVSGGYNRTRW